MAHFVVCLWLATVSAFAALSCLLCLVHSFMHPVMLAPHSLETFGFGVVCCHVLLQGTCPIAPGQNPATWMLEVTGGSMAMVSQPSAVDWPAIYSASMLAAANTEEEERLLAEGMALGPQLKMTSMYAQPFNIQARELSHFLPAYADTLTHAYLCSCWKDTDPSCTECCSIKSSCSHQAAKCMHWNRS